MIKAEIPNGGSPLAKPTNKGKHENHLCPYYKKTVYHSENECFKLDKNKDNRTSWYKVELYYLGPAMSIEDVAEWNNLNTLKINFPQTN